MNIFDDMRAAEAHARTTMQAADKVANAMAAMLEGRLRHVHYWNLVELKKELRDFNSRTREWKK